MSLDLNWTELTAFKEAWLSDQISMVLSLNVPL
jgi:hypothetical protein